MDILAGLDTGHLFGSTGVAAAIIYVAQKVVKPLLTEFLHKMPLAIDENTKAVRELIERQNRASGYNREEHAEIVTHLQILTNTLLKVNGEEPLQEKPADQPVTQADLQQLFRVIKRGGNNDF